jgi:hypothetical protein
MRHTGRFITDGDYSFKVGDISKGDWEVDLGCCMGPEPIQWREYFPRSAGPEGMMRYTGLGEALWKKPGVKEHCKTKLRPQLNPS